MWHSKSLPHSEETTSKPWIICKTTNTELNQAPIGAEFRLDRGRVFCSCGSKLVNATVVYVLSHGRVSLVPPTISLAKSTKWLARVILLLTQNKLSRAPSTSKFIYYFPWKLLSGWPEWCMYADYAQPNAIRLGFKASTPAQPIRCSYPMRSSSSHGRRFGEDREYTFQHRNHL